MTIHRRHLLALPGLAAIPAAAQESFPNRPIRLIVPFATGGPSDIVARLLAPKMSAVLGQPVVVESRPGAGGVTGMDAVAKATPDGHTIGLGSAGGLAISPGLPQPMPYDTLRDFAPLTLAVIVHEPLVVPAKMPWRTLGELIAAASSPSDLRRQRTGLPVLVWRMEPRLGGCPRALIGSVLRLAP
jgi:tripartite-type tricarboxylate transporter receptor subunit TctC